VGTQSGSAGKAVDGLSFSSAVFAPAGWHLLAIHHELLQLRDMPALRRRIASLMRYWDDEGTIRELKAERDGEIEVAGPAAAPPHG
jgi:hypothetical protein